MALNYTTLQALINDKYIKVLQDVIFTKKSYLLSTMKAKAKTFNERKIVVPLEYGKSSTTRFLPKYGTITLTDQELVTAAEYTPQMMSDALVIALEDELQNKSDMAITKLITVKMKNLQKSVEEYLSTHLWKRTTTVTSGDWNHLDFLVSSSALTVGGIATSDASWWLSKSLDCSTLSGTSTTEPDLIDSTKQEYLPKLIRRGIAMSNAVDGSNPDLIVMPQYLWDLLEQINEEKRRFSVDDRIEKMGFSNLTFRGIPIVADNYMVVAQTGDTDGRIYFLKMEYLYMFLNSGADFSLGEFQKQPNSNVRSAIFNAYGNIAISNRRGQVVFTDLYSPQSYVNE